LDREEERKESNNPFNPNKNLCCLAVTNYFGTTKLWKYLHNSGDLIISISKKHNVVDKDFLVKNLIVEDARKILKKNTLKENVRVKGYLLSLPDHTILLNEFGKTIVDVDPEYQDVFDDRIINECNMII
jgi:acyl-ACP thioesterase